MIFMSQLKVYKIVVGALEENCYIIQRKQKVILIDPGDEAEKIEKYIQGFNLVGILLTHNHFDHTGALSYFEEKYHVKHNEMIPGFPYKVIKTPGHTKDSLTFYFIEEQIMFTGDFLFEGSIGRMDLPGGNSIEMKASLELISKYPNNTIIYPGHGEKSILGEEKKYFSYYMSIL